MRAFSDERLAISDVDDSHVVVLFGDADEIPRPSSINALRNVAPLDVPVALSMSWHHYAYNIASVFPWGAFGAYNEGPFAVSLSMLRSIAPSTFRRAMRHGLAGLLFADMSNAGWHFSRFGGFESVKRKMLASANFGYHQIDERDDSVLSRLVDGGVPVLNLQGGVDGSTLFAWESTDDITKRLPAAVQNGAYHQFFWSRKSSRDVRSDKIAATAARALNDSRKSKVQ